MRIVCVGGGPAGLYSAVLIKRARPDWSVTVCERNPPGETFGFGVVFSEPTLSVLEQADPRMHRELLARSVRWDPIEVRLGDGALRCHGQGFAAIGRQALLEMLRSHAEEAGVDCRFGVRLDPGELPPADVVIAADGARSALRASIESTAGTTIDVGATKYIWFATTKRFDCLTFLFEEGESGAFAVHAYPFAEGASTFIVETDEASWRRAGFDRPPPSSGDDLESLAYCEALFARHLDGHRLLSNRSLWSNFRTVSTKRWHDGSVVLIGDAAHTAHFSVGSGTKMAFEDAIALSAALATASDPTSAFVAYEAERRPRVNKVQQSAGPSLYWWEHFGEAMKRPLEPFAFRFLTRNHSVNRESLLKRDAAFVDRVDAWFRGETGSSGRARDASFAVRGTTLANRIVTLRAAASRGSSLVLSPISEALPPPSPSDQLHGIVLDAAAARAPLSIPSWAAWLALSFGGEAVDPSVLDRVRRAWDGPLSIDVEVAEQSIEEMMGWAETALARGIDVLTVTSAPGRHARAFTVADALRLRFGAPIMVACPEELADTLLLSERADLCLVVGGAPR